MISLNEILKTDIFTNCKVLSGVKNLNKPIKTVSILETAEFRNYIIPNSLVLTTMYLIKNNLSLFEELIYSLHEKDCPGIVIKLGKYINEIPLSIIDLANKLEVTIMTIDYDMNLSLLVNGVVSEIQKSEFVDNSFSAMYAQIAKNIDKNPSTDELIRSCETIKDLDLLIQNVSNSKTRYTSEKIKHLYDKNNTITEEIIKDGEDILFITDVKYEGVVIYRLALLTKETKRYLIHNYAEIYKMMAVIIYQKKQEIIMKQDQFLLDFVSNITSNFTTNIELINASKFYNWNIKYPLLIFVISIKGNNLSRIILASELKKLVSSVFFITSDQFRYVFLNDLIIFISNTSFSADNKSLIENLYENIKNKLNPTELRIAYSNPIGLAHEIPAVFSILSEALHNKQGALTNSNFLNENYVRTISLLKTLDYDKVKSFTYHILNNLIEYEEKTKLPLITTLYIYIQSHFSIKAASEVLYIHPNSLKYRLSIIERLGYNINLLKQDYFDLYLALYFYINLMEGH